MYTLFFLCSILIIVHLIQAGSVLLELQKAEKNTFIVERLAFSHTDADKANDVIRCFSQKKGETQETRREAKMCMIHKRQQQPAQKRQREPVGLSRAPLNSARETSFLSFISVCGLLEAAGGVRLSFSPLRRFGEKEAEHKPGIRQPCRVSIVRHRECKAI